MNWVSIAPKDKVFWGLAKAKPEWISFESEIGDSDHLGMLALNSFLKIGQRGLVDGPW